MTKASQQAYTDARNQALDLAEKILRDLRDTDEESPHWGHVGSMAHIASQLGEVAATTESHL